MFPADESTSGIGWGELRGMYQEKGRESGRSGKVGREQPGDLLEIQITGQISYRRAMAVVAIQ